MNIFDDIRRTAATDAEYNKPIKCVYLGQEEMERVRETARTLMGPNADPSVMLGGIKVFEVKAERHYHVVYEQEQEL